MNSKRDGAGELVFPDGSLYKGFFKMGAIEGFGKYRRADGIKFKGIWKHENL